MTIVCNIWWGDFVSKSPKEVIYSWKWTFYLLASDIQWGIVVLLKNNSIVCMCACLCVCVLKQRPWNAYWLTPHVLLYSSRFPCLWKVFSVLCSSLHSLLYTALRPQMPVLPFLFHYFFFTLYTNSFYFSSLEHPSLWLFSNFLTSMSIPNETDISENSKVTSTNERKFGTFIFLGLSYLT